MLMKLSDYVMDTLVRQGVQHLFLLPGGGCMHMVDSAGSCAGLEFVACLHEQSCAFAAEAYGEYTNRLGTMLVTTGPGGTNALTGVAAAWIESAPMLVLSGQAKREDLIGARGVRSMGVQEIDIVSMVKPITKFAVTVLDPQMIRYYLEQAIYVATHGRKGPVWLDIPLDVQAATIYPETLPPFLPDDTREAPTDPTRLTQDATETVFLLAHARRPALLIGNGVRTAGAAEMCLQVAERLALPILTTWKALDLVPDVHPLFIGRPGAVAQRGANFVQQNADVLLIIGARLDLPQTAFNHEHFAPHAKKIMVDIDPAELNKMRMPHTTAIHADARVFLQACLDLLPGAPESKHQSWLEQCHEWVKRYPVVLPEYWASPQGPVNSYTLIETISALSESNDLLVPGSSGPASDHFMQAFRVKAGQRVLNAPGLGAMGTGIPATIGACIASGGRRTICVVGDGGFQLNIQELETVRRLQLPIKFFVLDNGGYASIMAMQRKHFKDHYVASNADSGLTFPSLARVGAAFQLPVIEIVAQQDLRAGVAEALAYPGPVLCVVTTDPEQATAPCITSSVQEDGSILSHPMEDMWPFLERDEFRANMLD
jgi:acetolactate synthase I/II/III large subunit